MKIRIYYKPNGEVLSVVIADSNDEWNFLECGSPIGILNCDSFTFDLTEENMEKYMESADIVNLEEIEQERFEQNEEI